MIWSFQRHIISIFKPLSYYCCLIFFVRHRYFFHERLSDTHMVRSKVYLESRERDREKHIQQIFHMDVVKTEL